MKLHSKIHGQGNPIIVLHGLFGMSDNWNSFGKEFSKEFEVHLIDLRNHGRSPHHPAFNYTVLSSDLLEYINENKLKHPILIGHSLGGKVAMKFVFTHLNYIKKLVVVDIAPRVYSTKFHEDILNILSKVNLSRFKTRSELNTALSIYWKEDYLRSFLLKNIYRDEEKNFQWRLNIQILKEKIGNIQEASFIQGKISTPSLFLKGNSLYITEEDEKIIREHFSNSTIESIENAGHWLHVENPKEFYKKVAEFIREE